MDGQGEGLLAHGDQILLLDVRELIALEILDGQDAEDVVDDARGELHVRAVIHQAGRFELRHRELLDKLLQWHTVLEANRDGDGEAVEEAAQAGAGLAGVDEDLAEPTIRILAGLQEDRLTADLGLEDFSVADGWQLLLNAARVRGNRRRSFPFLRLFIHIRVIEREAGTERLAELGCVTVDGDRFDAELPGLAIDLVDVGDGGVSRQIHRLADPAADERLDGGHHEQVAERGDGTGRPLAGSVGAVEHAEVLRLEERTPFERAVACDERFERVCEGLIEAKRLEAGYPVAMAADGERLADRSTVGERALRLRDLLFGEAGAAEGLALRVGELSVAKQVALHRLDLVLGIAERFKGGGDGAVDDPQESPAGEGLELDEGVVRLDTGGVAVHQQADRAGWRDGRGLCVAEAVKLAEPEHVVGCGARLAQQVFRAVPEGIVRFDAQALIVVALVGSAPVIGDHAQHVLLVALVGRERPDSRGDLGAGGVRRAVHDGCDAGGDPAPEV